MTLFIDKRWDSGRGTQDWYAAQGDGDTVDVNWIVYDDQNREDIDAEVRAWLDPQKVGNLPVQVETDYWLRRWSVEYLGSSLWHVPAHYARVDPRETQWTGDTTGGTAHITQSRETMLRKYSPELVPSAIVPDFKGAIGVNGDTVQGCDIVVPALHLTAVKSFPLAQFDQDFEETLFTLTGTINYSPFRRRKKGELLFLGATWTKKFNLAFVECTYKFAGSKEVQYGTVDEAISDVGEFVKEGWHYLWMKFRRSDSPGVYGNPHNTIPPNPPAGAPGSAAPAPARFDISKPEFVYVERVYKYADFALLGLGDGNDPPPAAALLGTNGEAQANGFEEHSS